MEQAEEAANPGLEYYNLQYKGFFAVKATKETHIAEFFVVDPKTILTDYAEARDTSGNIVADFLCDTQLTTTAGIPGSLDRVDECSQIEFETTRPAVWDLPFPVVESDTDIVELSNCGYEGCQFDVKVAGESEADEPVADEPVAEEPEADEPAADEPAADEPAADEPADDVSSAKGDSLLVTVACSISLLLMMHDYGFDSLYLV